MQLPQKLLADLKKINGFDEQSFIEAHQQVAVTSVRLHPIKKSSVVTDNEQVPWCGYGRYLDKRPVFTLDPLYHAGAYYVQEASSMFLQCVLEQVLPARENLRVLDLCAAPGGKSTLIASLLDKSSLLISNEVIRTRASILEENMTRWGYMNTLVTSNDPKEFSKLGAYFDVVVVDAPCSGSGLFRKDAHALNEWSEANVQLCCQRQQRILADIWPAIKEDGLLIYATCSYSPQEDEAILDWLANEFDVETMQLNVPTEWGIVHVVTEKEKINGYRFFPDRVKGEGFFIAALRKREVTSAIRYPKYRTVKDEQIKNKAGYLLTENAIRYVQSGAENYSAIHELHEADLHLVREHLYLRKTGLSLGVPMAKEWVPSHEAAMSVDLAHTVQRVAVDKEQALKFLKKEEMHLPPMEKGWNIVTYEGLGLGWIKNLGNRVNNYLPKHWRIRMEITDADWK